MNLEEEHFLRGLGLRLRRHREGLGWTQAELAQRCDLHRTFIGSVERGERNVSILNLRLIARVLRVGLPELIAETAEREGRQED
jgi:transcriptional regulator with XRE-family HTH domain